MFCFVSTIFSNPRDPITETENGFMEPKYLAFRFGDESWRTPLAHHVTRWARIPRAFVQVYPCLFPGDFQHVWWWHANGEHLVSLPSKSNKFAFLGHWKIVTTLRIIGPSYGGVWPCIGGFWDLQTTSFEIPWFFGNEVILYIFYTWPNIIWVSLGLEVELFHLIYIFFAPPCGEVGEIPLASRYLHLACGFKEIYGYVTFF